MFLSPVPGSPAEEQPAADFYPQAKLGFGGLSMDDEGDARMSSPLATRPLKRNKLATPRDKGTPASRASTATDGVDSDASAGAASDDDECGGFSLRVPRDGSAGPARSLFGRHEGGGGPGREARDAPPPANVNPFAPRDLNRCDSIDTNSGSWTFESGLKPAPAAPAAPRRGGGARRDAAADASSRFRNDFEVVREIGAGSFGTVRKVRSRIDGCLYAVKSTRARPSARPAPGCRVASETRRLNVRTLAQAQFRGQLHRDRTLKEVFALAALSARDEGAEGLRHIVRYYQAWIEDERLYIQTELCDASLESRVRRGRFLPTPPAVWSFLRQMLLALELLHARGLVHLDLKPGNIFVKGEDPRGRPGGLRRVRFLPPRSRPGRREARAERLGRGVCVTQARTATN